MEKFPKTIQDAMRATGTAATCVPVQIDEGQWESALFVHVAGPECKQDRRILKHATGPTPAMLHTELLTHANAAVVLFRLEVLTIPNDALIYEILLTPGKISSHYECLKLLTKQESLYWFFGDTDYRIIQSQRQKIDNSQHVNFETLTREAFAHDSVVRIASRYDANAALAEIASHYQPRKDITRNNNEREH